MTFRRARFKKTSAIVLGSLAFQAGQTPAGWAASRAIPGLFGGANVRPAPPPGALPSLGQVIRGATVDPASGGRLVIRQNDPKAVIEWLSFDVGEGAEVRFDQKTPDGEPATDWVALNRIFDQNPSQIFGRLSADGRVYLINQNGMLFGPTASVNVHGLLASSLNVKNEDFLAGALNFRAEDYRGGGAAGFGAGPVSNHGRIETGALGEVFLFAPQVENNGVIVSPSGQIALAAGTEVFLSSRPDGRGLLVKVTAPQGSTATNFDLGQLIADTGLAGLYGRAVNQEGLVRATTAIKRNGIIELRAVDRVTTGAASVTETPITASDERVHQSFPFKGGAISVQGLDAGQDVALVEHRGLLSAPAGTVTVRARDRVFLDGGSEIDVSGTWADRPAGESAVTATLNSVQLRDDQEQKGGLLQGQQISVDPSRGTAIGDISDSLVSEEQTAQERSTEGGSIQINGSGAQGEVVMKEGARLAFAGGGVRYGAGAMATTKLVSGRRVYDIADAPEAARYDAVASDQRFRDVKFGAEDAYQGLYLGGARPLGGRVPGHIEGADAGSLTIVAPVAVLEGAFDGSVRAGPLQTRAADPTDGLGLLLALGLRRPTGGTLVLGADPAGASAEQNDARLQELRVTGGEPTLPARLEALDPLPGGQVSILSADRLSEGGLSSVRLNANLKVTLDEAADLRLAAGGGLTVRSRGIEVLGRIEAPAGTVDLRAVSNRTSEDLAVRPPNYAPIPGTERVLVGAGASLAVSGVAADRSTAEGGLIQSELGSDLLNGGKVIVQDGTEKGGAAIVARGARIEADGGYEIGRAGAVRAGNAGSVSVIGTTAVLEGQVVARSLPGKDGGKLTLHAETVTVGQAQAGIVQEGADGRLSAEALRDPTTGALVGNPRLPGDFAFSSPIPETAAGHLVFDPVSLAGTGITRLDLRAEKDLIVAEGVSLRPDSGKLPWPAALASLSGLAAAGQSVRLGTGGRPLDPGLGPELGKTSLSLAAAVGLSGKLQANPVQLANGRVLVAPGAALEVAPGGTVSIDGGGVELAGSVAAPGGSIKVSASGGSDVFNKPLPLRVRDRAALFAGGYTVESAIDGRSLAQHPVAAFGAGTVSLASGAGDLVIEEGTTIDVSGSGAGRDSWPQTDGSVRAWTPAGAPGAVDLQYFRGLTLAGDLRADGVADGLPGGTFGLHRLGNTRLGQAQALELDGSLLEQLQAKGFDSFVFQSDRALLLSGPVDVQARRGLTLDAPELRAKDSASSPDYALRAPWLRWTNSSIYAPTTARGGPASLTLAGDWIDLEGQVGLQGFDHVRLAAGQDLRLSDRMAELSGALVRWGGSLSSPGQLEIEAQRVYPTTLSRFQIAADEVEIRRPSGPAASDRPIFSAGGALTIEAGRILNEGDLAAPLGTLELRATGPEGRIVLADGSRTTVSGSAAVPYGTSGELTWTIPDRTSNQRGASLDVTAAPRGAVLLSAAEIVAREGASVDAAAGGSVTNQFFAPGLEGSTNPLFGANTFVILPDDPLSGPGDAVYLAGGGGVAAGLYTLLPAAFAFQPGALVVTDLARTAPAGTGVRTPTGDLVVEGYRTVAGAGLQSPLPQAFSIRRAADVLKAGHFTVRGIGAVDGGSVSVDAPTTVFSGSVATAGGAGGADGTLRLSAAGVAVQAVTAGLPAGFDDRAPLPQEFLGKITITSSALSQADVGELHLGEVGRTTSIRVAAGADIRAPQVVLGATDAIVVEAGGRVQGLGDAGTVRLAVPDGTLSINENAAVTAGRSVALDASSLELAGELSSKGGALAVAGDTVTVSASQEGATGLVLRPAVLEEGGFSDVTLTARSELVFQGDVTLGAKALTLDAPRLRGTPAQGASSVALSSGSLRLQNSSGSAGQAAAGGAGTLALEGGEVVLGGGDLALAGFGTVRMESTGNAGAGGDLVLEGAGQLTADADLELVSSRVTAAAVRDPATDAFQLADHGIDAGSGALRVTGVSRPADPLASASSAGARLRLTAAAIEQTGVVDLPAGTVAMTATGTGAGVVLGRGARLNVAGTEEFGAGAVSLTAEHGSVNVGAGAAVDLSAGAQGDGGALTLAAPEGELVLTGAVSAVAQGSGRGGAATLDALRFDGQPGALAAIGSLLTSGGFDEKIDLRARAGDLVVPRGVTLSAAGLRLAADAGAIAIDGGLAAGTAEAGGSVELCAFRDLTVNGTVSAAGSTAGGEAVLSSRTGWVRVNAGGTVDVSGGGGKVTVRVPRTAGNDGALASMQGSVRGAARVDLEAVRAHEVDTATFNAPAARDAWDQENRQFVNAVAGGDGSGLAALRGTVDPAAFHLLPGLELDAAEGLALTRDWDLTSWRYGPAQEPGVLTVTSRQDVAIGARLADHPTPFYELGVSASGAPSWGLRLVAGAEPAAAGATATRPGVGNLSLPYGGLVYSEGGDVTLASGGDTVLGPGVNPGYMDFESTMDLRYNVGSYGGEVRGLVGGDLKIDGGSIQTAVGNIALEVGKDVELRRALERAPGSTGESLGSIRTTGRPGGAAEEFWRYAGGGNLRLAAGGRVVSDALPEGYVSEVENDGWDSVQAVFDYDALKLVLHWGASYGGERATEGLATMGGGDLTVEAGGSFFSQAGAFGTGNLAIHAGGDASGRFLARQGRLDVSSLGSYGKALSNNSLELFDVRAKVVAQGDLSLGAIVNPTLALPALADSESSLLGFTEDTSVRLRAVTGDLSMSGKTRHYELPGSLESATHLLPSTVDLEAGRDLLFAEPDRFGSGEYTLALLPSASGNLRLAAGRDIRGGFRGQGGTLSRTYLVVSDLDPGLVYGKSLTSLTEPSLQTLASPSGHRPGVPLHQADESPVEVTAGRNLSELSLSAPKPARIEAGGDIVDLAYRGQNLRGGDVSRVGAGGRILLGRREEFSRDVSGFVQGGPGALVVQAGEGLDLGSTRGIQSVANQDNQALPPEGASLVVDIGYGAPLSPEGAANLFRDLRAAGEEYSRLLSKGETEAAKEKVAQIREEVIAPALGAAVKEGGNLEMVRSQISTQLGGDIFLAVAGDANVGQSTFTSESQKRSTGIFTAFGGDINVLAGGDLNVNEARVMTFFGGDVLAWVDRGSINAGRGSKAAINVSPPRLVCDVGGVNCRLVFEPPAVGSGIRTLTYDPDGFEGPLQAPPQGDAYLFAPSGEIDAGEAGIAGKNVVLAALKVLNVQNISFSAGSVGVPVASQGLGLGALAGSGAVADAAKQAQAMTTAALDQPKAAQTQGGSEEMSQLFTPKAMKVDIVGFDEDEDDANKDKEKDKKK